MISLPALLVLAFGLDLLLGDPRWLPHPVSLIGRLAKGGEKLARRLLAPRLAGVLTVLLVLTLTGAVVWLLLAGAALWAPWARTLVELYLLYASLAACDLARHSRRVFQALQDGDLPQARLKVAMIVGRDTAALDEQGVVRATVESVAENIVDGVTAPLFWAAVAGPVGALLYKAVNTMDSLFGYKNDEYLQFGWAAARLDDCANYIPARLTAGLVIAAAAMLGLDAAGAARIWRRDRKCHASPNSGQSEAAVAGALRVRLGGPGRYFGQLVAKPCLGEAIDPLGPQHITAANRLMLLASGLGALLFAGLRALISAG